MRFTLKPWRAAAILFVALPVPVLVGVDWWYAPAWLSLREVLYLYDDLDSVFFTALLAAGIFVQVALWLTLAACLVARNIHAPHSPLSRVFMSRAFLVVLLALLAVAWWRPVYWVVDDAAGHWESFGESLRSLRPYGPARIVPTQPR